MFANIAINQQLCVSLPKNLSDFRYYYLGNPHFNMGIT
jgi:hypothetical protein